MGAIRAALRQRGLRQLLGASLISATGDWVLRVGLAYYVYVLTGSTLASALILLASFVPQIVLGSVAGVFVDRWDTKRTMIVSNLLLAAGLLPLLAVRHAGQAWIVYAVLAWEGCVQQLFTPAEQALLPQLADDDYLVTANALNGQVRDLSRFVGSAVGGIVAAMGGITALAFIDIASFLVAAALIGRIFTARREGHAAPGSGHPGSGSPGRGSSGTRSLGGRLALLRAEWSDGLRMATHQRVLRVILIFLLVTCVGEGIMSTLFAPFVRSVLHGSAADYGFIVSAQAVGGIAGGLEDLPGGVHRAGGGHVRPYPSGRLLLCPSSDHPNVRQIEFPHALVEEDRAAQQWLEQNRSDYLSLSRLNSAGWQKISTLTLSFYMET